MLHVGSMFRQHKIQISQLFVALWRALRVSKASGGQNKIAVKSIIYIYISAPSIETSSARTALLCSHTLGPWAPHKSPPAAWTPPRASFGLVIYRNIDTMYIYIYVYLYIYVYIYMYISICIYIYTYVYYTMLILLNRYSNAFT